MSDDGNEKIQTIDQAQRFDHAQTKKETAEDAVIAGPRKENHQQIFNQALDSNQSKHSGSANIEKPYNNDPSLQLVEAIPGTDQVEVVAERKKHNSSEISENSTTFDFAAKKVSDSDGKTNDSRSPRTGQPEKDVAGTHQAFKQVWVQKGDTLWRIARGNLESGAGNEQIKEYAKIIARDNRLQNPDNIHPGQTLLLRGFQNDKEEIASPGKKPEPNPVVAPEVVSPPIDAERDDEVTAVPAEKPQQLSFDELQKSMDRYYTDPARFEDNQISDQLREQIGKDTDRAHFLDVAKKHGIDVSENIEKIEDRVARQETSAAEIKKTYEQLERLLETKSTAGVSDGQREIIAQQILEHAARPDQISQGQFNTCNVSTVERRIFGRTPSAAANIITDLALTGKFTAVDGTTVDLTQSFTAANGQKVAEQVLPC